MHRLNEILDQRAKPLRLFFRNDDAGWRQDRLDALLAVSTEQGAPIDLAVIPAALTEQGARELLAWRQRHAGIGLHQHGYAHLNHEPEGNRKCEFGAARPIERQCADIAMGRERLNALLGVTDPIFTPPWNRCLPETVAMLPRLGLACFSDDGGQTSKHAVPFHLPIDVDWERERKTDSLLKALSTVLADAESRAGIMLHHATMDAAALDTLAGFLSLVRRHPKINLAPMRSLLEPMSCAD